jgi:hypothetical protein
MYPMLPVKDDQHPIMNRPHQYIGYPSFANQLFLADGFPALSFRLQQSSKNEVEDQDETTD